MSGWIKLHRKMRDSDLWLSEPFTKGQAWIDLIMLARFKEGYARIRGQRVDLQRGQLAWSEVGLAKRWQWSRKKVRKFLSEMEKEEHQIAQQKSNVTTLITIINFDKYQSEDTAEYTTEETAECTAEDTRNKKEKEGKEGEKKRESSNEDLSSAKHDDAPKKSNQPPCPHQEIIKLYHELLPELPQVNVWNQSSKKNLQARWREDKARQSLDWWKWFFAEKIGNSDFLMGRVKEFRADLDWIVRPSNFQKIMNGRYQNRDSAQQQIQPRNYKEAQDAERRQRALRLISQKQGRDGNAEDGNNQDGIGQTGNCLPSSGIQ